MLILNEARPSISLYYLGACLINFINEYGFHEIHLTDLYLKFNSTHPTPFNRFMLTLDWLHMIGFIDSNNEGILICT
ncbi:ABC-three component system middle component 6 [Acinetobacter modestus]|uniref:ABC-three component system middle component 6 n=1 Tax=Acinetobacter modestus TaxID=1776740 RepID=UPI003AFB4D0E